ncbi:MAG: hypothetical protein HY673_13060 [Chloroflexi bacterium]|nr:hypothetical protein [Chloroflexota bacterium]
MKETSLEVYDPAGAIEVTEIHAPRLPDLHGKTIGQLSLNQWEADRILPMITSLLQKQFPTAKFIDYARFPTLSSNADVPDLEAAVKAKGVQAVIVGNAA